MQRSAATESKAAESDSALVLLLRALAFGLGFGGFYLGAGIISDYLIGGLAFLVPGLAICWATLFYRGPHTVLRKVMVGLGGLLLMVPVVLFVILILFAVS